VVNAIKGIAVVTITRCDRAGALLGLLFVVVNEAGVEPGLVEEEVEAKSLETEMIRQFRQFEDLRFKFI
jgi:hypothetical protein